MIYIIKINELRKYYWFISYNNNKWIFNNNIHLLFINIKNEIKNNIDLKIIIIKNEY